MKWQMAGQMEQLRFDVDVNLEPFIRFELIKTWKFF